VHKKIKTVILAGGFGTRLEEETVLIPKPMVMIGHYPILIHIMKIYSSYGFNDFIICLGYKGYVIKEYLANYFVHNSDLTFDFSKGEEQIVVHSKKVDPWRVTLIDTGLNTKTGGRIKRIQPYIDNQTFFFTYGDGVSDVNIPGLLDFHLSHGKIATVSAVQPPGKYGGLQIDDNSTVREFREKPAGDGAWINGGFFVLNYDVFKYIEGDESVWEFDPLENLSRDGQLMAYLHRGFWKCMDTKLQKKELLDMWNSGNAPWKLWEG